MSASAAIADSVLRRAFSGQLAPRDLDVLFQVRLVPSALRVPVSTRDFATNRHE